MKALALLVAVILSARLFCIMELTVQLALATTAWLTAIASQLANLAAMLAMYNNHDVKERWEDTVATALL